MAVGATDYFVSSSLFLQIHLESAGRFWHTEFRTAVLSYLFRASLAGLDVL
jgi:hypothetical protein